MIKIQRRVTKAYFDLAYCKYKPLIYKLSRRIGSNEIQIEEMQSLASLEILKCLICYNGQSSFMTFLYMRLSGAFRHFRDSEKTAIKNHIPIEYATNIEWKNNDIDLNIIAKECLECLNEEEKEVVIDLFFNGKTTRETAKSRMTTPSTIQRIKSRSIEKMQLKYGVKRS